MDEKEALDELKRELDRQRERIERTEKELDALGEEIHARKTALEGLLRHLKSGEWRIEDSIARKTASGADAPPAAEGEGGTSEE